MEWIECVRWCHRNEDFETVDALIESLADLSMRSSYASPILTKLREGASGLAGGYVVLYPGALASIGTLRSESTKSEELRTESEAINQGILADLTKELFQTAFAQGAEMVQAISPLIASHISNDTPSAFVSVDSYRDEVLRRAGMSPIAKLVQMECIGIPTIPRQTLPVEGIECGELCFVQHHEIQSKPWNHLVERTYVDTLDVPELNGLRHVENTLAGYSSTVMGVPQTWWVVQCQGTHIGCLLLTPTADRCCELTYLGLVPEWRGKGLSKAIMNFVRDWALESGIEAITLAVDLRNTPAIRLYQSCGFMTQRFVQAWICFPESIV